MSGFQDSSFSVFRRGAPESCLSQAVPDLVKGAVHVVLLDQDDVAVVLPVVGLAGRGVGRDEAVDEFPDGGEGGVLGFELGEVFGGFERDHMWLPSIKTRRDGGSAGSCEHHGEA